MRWTGPPSIALAAGGTAGHVFPAIAIAEGLRARGVDDVFFVGTANGLERELVPRAGFPLELVAGLPWQGVSIWGRAAAAVSVGQGFFDARRILRRRTADLVIGFGGYASIGTVLAARALGLRTALVEPNVDFGLANRLLLATTPGLYTALDTRVRGGLEDRTCRCGVPVRAAIAALASEEPRRLRTDLPRRVLVLAGPARSEFLDHRIPEMLAQVFRRGVSLKVVHQTEAELEPVRQRYGSHQATVVPFIHDIAARYANADFVIARSGAGTLAELAMCGLPSLLVPWKDAAEDHQRTNARAYAADGAALLVEEESWDASVVAMAVENILLDPQAWQSMSMQARQHASTSSVDHLIGDLVAWKRRAPR